MVELNLRGGLGVRLDTHIYPGYKIPPFYDSMVAKLITYGSNRKEAIDIMRRALGEFYISPIKTTIGLQVQIINHASFLAGNLSTHFLEKIIKSKNEG